MAASMRIAGSTSVVENCFCFPISSKSRLNLTSNFMNPFLFSPNLRNRRKKRIPTTPKAALVFYSNPMESVAENPVKLKMTAEITIRKIEQIKYMEMVLNHWSDNISTDPTQSGVVLQLISSHIDPNMNTESPVKEEMTTYVPRDEALADSKTKAVAQGKLKGLIKNLIPGFRNVVSNSSNDSIKEFSDINLLYKKRSASTNHNPFPSLFTNITKSINEIYKFDPPKGISSIIESYFTPERYCMEITQSAYQDWWRFDLEGLPADLIRRGMAEPDPTQEYGLRLLIEDYPYANDGLLIWSAIEKLVRTYVKYYYPDPSVVQFDNELQAFYNEFINVGHADISQAHWWPQLSTPDELISLLTTILWTVTAKHAALNFGQYHYGGYIPVRPPFMRRLVPKEGDVNYPKFLVDPQGYFLSALPSLPQSTYFMSVLDILSTHSSVEEYIGDRKDLSTWSADTEILEAFYSFSMEIKKIEKEIERRNSDPKLRNRCGPGISPYESLMPSSGPGVTGRGVPNSISM